MEQQWQFHFLSLEWTLLPNLGKDLPRAPERRDQTTQCWSTKKKEKEEDTHPLSLCSLFLHSSLPFISLIMSVCQRKGGVIKRSRTGGNIQISDRREVHQVTHLVQYANTDRVLRRWPHCLKAERHTQTIHKQHRSRAHTWKTYTVQTWEVAFLFCHTHANLRGGRNNRH